MKVVTPKIDLRENQAIVKQLKELLLYYCPEWGTLEFLEKDKQAGTFIHIFARLVEIIIQRLNRVPDKNFLTFLDLIGIQLLPPRVARVPLTFTMAEGSSQYSSVPSKTQVSTDGDVVFETEKGLTVILPAIVKVVSLNPPDDRWTDHSPVLIEKTAEKQYPENLFKGDELVPHCLFIGDNDLFSLEESKTITLSIDLKTDADPEIPWEVKWYHYSDDSPDPVQLEATGVDKNGNNSIDVVNLLKSGTITFTNVDKISESTITGCEKETGRERSWTNHFIFARLNTPVPGQKLPEINTIKTGLAMTPGLPSILPGIAFFNKFSIDLTSDFYPFGEKPKFNDTFYIGSKEVFFKKDAVITINVVLSNLDPPDTTNITLTWEFGDEEGFRKIGETTQAGVYSAHGEYAFTDTTNAFKKGGVISFRCPQITEREIYGEKNYWIRVRITGGDYGKEARYEEIPLSAGTGTIQSSGSNITGAGTRFWHEVKVGDSIIAGGQTRIATSIVSNISLAIDSGFTSNLPSGTAFSIKKAGWGYIPPTYKAPSVAGIKMHYTLGRSGIPQVVLSYNDFTYRDQTSLCKNVGEYFTPFTPVSDEHPALYLGFDTTIATLPVSLFFSLVEKPAGATGTPVLVPGSGTISSNGITVTGTGTAFMHELKKGDGINVSGEIRIVAIIRSDSILDIDTPFTTNLPGGTVFSYYTIASTGWEYWNGKKWTAMNAEDNTMNLTKREIIQFTGPSDIVKIFCFGNGLFWIRLLLEKGNYEDFPWLKSLHTNVVWAYNMVTVTEEIMGSSSGNPNQLFRFAHFPVLQGQKILVHETALTEEERQVILSDEGEDAIIEIPGEAGNIIETWVRWHGMNNFYFSGPADRHYSIDRINGTITFGDGARGLIPPPGKDNIKCSTYCYGGGQAGNVKSNTVTKLKKTFPYIDSVTNPVEADGGSGQENPDRVMERGPQTLKHRDRAVTTEDFEWLARESSLKVAKVKCFSTENKALQFKPGWITIIVVPESEEPKPLPSRELIKSIEEYLFERTSSHLVISPSQVNLIPPGYIRVGVNATVAYTSIGEAKIIEGRIIDNLKQFFHPLHGGPEKMGWDFGRNVYISEVYEVMEKTEGVDYVEGLHLNASIQMYSIRLKDPITTLTRYPRQSSIASPDKKIVFSLADTLPSNEQVNLFVVTGFKEGDRITLVYGVNRLDLTIASVSGDVLECLPQGTEVLFPAGSSIESADERIKSYILNGIEAGSVITYLKAAVFEADEQIILIHKNDSSISQPAIIVNVNDDIDTVSIEDHYLVYSGDHFINRKEKEELVFPYLINTSSRQIHDLNNSRTNCQIDEIIRQHRMYVRILDSDYLQNEGINRCDWCFNL